MSTLGRAFVGVSPDMSGWSGVGAKVFAALKGVKATVPVGANTTPALTSIDALKLRLADLAAKVVEARVGLNDKAAIVELDALNVRLIKLGNRVASPKITVDGEARALADILAVSVALDRLSLKRATAGVAGAAGGLLGGAGGAAGAAGAAGPLAGAIPSGAVLAGAGVALAAVATGAAGIVPLLAAAGLGLASFGALAIPTITNLTGALGTLSTATSNYGTASLNLNTAIHQSPADLAAYHAVLKGLEPDLAAAAVLLANQGITWQSLTPQQRAAETALRDNSAAYKTLLPDQQKALTALLAERDAWNSLTPGQQAVSKQTGLLSAAFGNLAAAAEPLTLKVLVAGLKAASDLLPVLTPLATAAGGALVKLLGGFDKFAQSSGFKSFAQNMARLAGPAIATIGEGFGKVAVSLGKLLIAMESPDALRILAGLFDVLAGTVNVIAFLFIKLTPVIVNAFHTFAVNFDAMRHSFAADAHQISDDIDAIRVTWVNVGHAIETAWNTVVGAVKSAWSGLVSNVVGAMKTIIDAWLTVVGGIINGAAAAFGWIPLIGGKLKGAAAEFNTFRDQVNAALGGILNKTVTVTVVTAQTGAAGPGIKHAATGMYVAQGRPGVDDQVILAQRGELIVPPGLVSAGLVDHLRGLIPGFAPAAGAGVAGFGLTRSDLGLPAQAPADTSSTSSASSSSTAADTTAAATAATAATPAQTAAVAALRGKLSAGQAGELRAYAALVKAYASGLKAAKPGSYLAGHRASLTGELATLAKRQAAEAAAYAALGGTGLTAADLSKFATRVREETTTAHDKYLTLGQPGPAGALAVALGLLGGTAATKLAAAAKAAAAKAASGGPAGSVEALMKKMAAARGWTGIQWTDLLNVEMREAGFNLKAQNPHSPAYGLAQFIGGPAEYYAYGGNPNTAAGQITAFFNYIAQRYKTPAAAWQHELATGFYDKGGILPPGLSLALNTTGRPEIVVPSPGSVPVAGAGATPGGLSAGEAAIVGALRDVARRLDQLNGITAAVPARTGEHVAAAVMGPAGAAAFRGRYPQGGW